MNRGKKGVLNLVKFRIFTDQKYTKHTICNLEACPTPKTNPGIKAQVYSKIHHNISFQAEIYMTRFKALKDMRLPTQ